MRIDALTRDRHVPPPRPGVAGGAAVWRVVADGTRARLRAVGTGRRAALAFCAGSALALVVLLLGAAAVSHRVAEQEVLRDARHRVDHLAEDVIEPALGDGLLRGDPADVDRIDTAVRQRVLSDVQVRVKLWSSDGRVLYSDEPALVGFRHDLGASQRRSLEEGGTETVSPLNDAEHRFEAGEGPLIEVYRRVETPSGQPLLFELYSRASALEERQWALWWRFAPVTVGALLLLQLCQLPLVGSLVRRVRAAHEEHVWLLQRAVEASDTERRRIAGALHDTVVQQLSGASYVVSAAVGEVADAGRPDVAARLDSAARELRLGMREFRALLIDVYPPHLTAEGLDAGLRRLLAPLRAAGVDTAVELPDGLRLPGETEALLLRVAQECLRNAGRHAEAHTVRVAVEDGGDRVRLVVADDGVGYDPDSVLARRDGHLGTQVLHDLAVEAGGRLEVATAPGRGTAVRLEVPLP